MEAVLILSLVWFVAYKLVKLIQRFEESVHKRIKEQMQAEEKKTSGKSGAVRFFSIAQCGGSYTIGPGGFAAYIGGMSTCLYIRPVKVDRFIRIDLSSVTDFDLFAPDLPYVMNLNMAGVLANEMTRRQVGNSVYIEFVDDNGAHKRVELGEFKGPSAEDLLMYVLNATNGLSEKTVFSKN